MEILNIFIWIYMIIGGIYGLYLLLGGYSTIWQLPINVIFGPITLVYLYFFVKKNKKLPWEE